MHACSMESWQRGAKHVLGEWPAYAEQRQSSGQHWLYLRTRPMEILSTQNWPLLFLYIYFSAHKRLGVVKRRTTKQNEISAITTQYKMINAVAYLELLLSGTDPEFVAPRIHCCPSQLLLPLSATITPHPPHGEKNHVANPKEEEKTLLLPREEGAKRVARGRCIPPLLPTPATPLCSRSIQIT